MSKITTLANLVKPSTKTLRFYDYNRYIILVKSSVLTILQVVQDSDKKYSIKLLAEHNSATYITDTTLREVHLVHNKTIICMFGHHHFGTISLEDLLNDKSGKL